MFATCHHYTPCFCLPLLCRSLGEVPSLDDHRLNSSLFSPVIYDAYSAISRILVLSFDHCPDTLSSNSTRRIALILEDIEFWSWFFRLSSTEFDDSVVNTAWSLISRPISDGVHASIRLMQYHCNKSFQTSTAVSQKIDLWRLQTRAQSRTKDALSICSRVGSVLSVLLPLSS